MSLSRRRYDTLRSVVAGSTVANIQAVERELATLSDTYRVTPDKRKWLFLVVHVTRALDTYLTRLIIFHGLTPKRSLGPMLHQLSNVASGSAAHLPPHMRDRYKQLIGDVRNRYMHQADTFPTSYREVDDLAGDMR